MISTLISLFLTYQISAAADYENCGVLPLSDFCETITWKKNYTCSSITRRYNLTTSELVDYNWNNDDYSYTNSEFCSFFTEGDHVCVSKPNYTECGTYPFCVFKYPEYFCDTYTLDADYITCEEICHMYDITMEEFKEWNRHNALSLRCWDPEWMLEDEQYCVSKPNISDFSDCVSIAEAEDNQVYVSYYEELESSTIGPLYTSSSSRSTRTTSTSSPSSTYTGDYENCGALPLSDFCDTVIWSYNDTCFEFIAEYNLTLSQLVSYNWLTRGNYSDLYYCSMFTEGDEVCITDPDFSDCGAYPACTFEYPEYFCEYYTLDRDYVTCQEICEMYNITMEEFKTWNKHNDLPLRCWDPEWMLEDEQYCVSKPNISDFSDCVSIAEAEDNQVYVSYFENFNSETVGPLITSTSSRTTITTSSLRPSSTYESEYENCGDLPLSDLCETISWNNDSTCSEIADEYNLTVSQLVDYNWNRGGLSNAQYCSYFTEGDHVCVTKPDYSECGAYPYCVFEYPQYFCDYYTLEQDYITCEEICEMFNITMEEFKTWNKHNDLILRCWDDEWMLEDETYCVSKPNITDFSDCISIAVAEHNPSNVLYYERFNSSSIGPLYTSTATSSTRSSTRTSTRRSSTRSSTRTRSTRTTTRSRSTRTSTKDD
ncbi:hypothetical protein K6H09_005434 [Candida tropicalis]